MQTQVIGPVDLAHAPFAEGSDDSVTAQKRHAGRKTRLVAQV